MCHKEKKKSVKIAGYRIARKKTRLKDAENT